jgi:DMSO/TMAO reductase YedYZ molybdopterin-dependent catalytic subunit
VGGWQPPDEAGCDQRRAPRRLDDHAHTDDHAHVDADGHRGPAGPAPAHRPADGPSIVKPLPPELFTVHDGNAETRWEAMAGQGDLVPVDRFFVRNHTRTPLIDADDWRLTLHGTGLRGAPTAEKPVEIGYRRLRRMPAVTVTALVECAGNGRRHFTGQQGHRVGGVAWGLGAVGVARWRGVRLATVLEYAGLTDRARDVMPQGLDPDYVTGGVNLGRVRRPLPVAKALHDVLLAYEMNGEPLPPDHGYPVRVVVPGWIGIASIKWVGPIEVSAEPLSSPWNTRFYRLFGDGHPAEGSPLGAQCVKSAFELPWGARFTAGRSVVLRGRSWSGNGPVTAVEVSTDDGRSWQPARLTGDVADDAWRRWELTWRPEHPGEHTLRARATDVTGAGQPDRTRFNTLGYLFDGVVRHPVSVVRA